MADLFAVDFGPGDFSECDGTTGSPTVVSAVSHCAGFSLRATADNYYAVSTFTDQDKVFIAWIVRLSSVPASGTYYAEIAKLRGANNTTCICDVEFFICGGVRKIRIHRHFPAYASISTEYNWQPNTDYHVELEFYKHASAGYYRLYLNDSLLVEETGLNTNGAPQADAFRYGRHDVTSGWDPDVWIDCVQGKTTRIGTHDQVFAEDGEGEDFSLWDSTVDNPTFNALKRHCGTFSIECDVSQYGIEGAVRNVGHHKQGWLMLEFQLGELPETGEYVEFWRIDQGTTSLMRLLVKNDAGTRKWGFQYRSAGSLTEVLSTTATNPTTGSWYCVKVKLRLSTKDGETSGTYEMKVDDAALSDINQTSKDTDLTTFDTLRLYLTTDDISAQGFYDCMDFQTIDPGVCHVAGSEDVTSLTEEAECVVDLTEVGEGVCVFHKCNRLIDFNDFKVREEGRGITSLTVPFGLAVAKRDVFHIFVEGDRWVQGKVVKIRRERSSGQKILSIQNKTARLYGRFVLNTSHQYYDGQDAGEIAYDLVDHYFSGLFTVNNCDRSTGVVISDFDCGEKSVGASLEELAKRANCSFYIDATDDFHFFAAGDESTGITLGDADLRDCVWEDMGESIGTVIVKGYGVTGSYGSGLPEEVKQDRRILTEEEALEVAEQYHNFFNESIVAQAWPEKFVFARKGQTITVDAPHYELTNGLGDDLIIQSAEIGFGSYQAESVLDLGTEQPTFEFMVRQILTEVREQKINRISTHIGTETADADPFQSYTDILDLAAGSGYTVTTTEGNARTGTCSSEPDAIETCYVETIITRTGGWSHVRISLVDGATLLHSWGADSYANLPVFKLTAYLPYDLSGKTLYVKATSHANNSLVITATLKVRQFIQHAHSMSQSQTHEFD